MGRPHGFWRRSPVIGQMRGAGTGYWMLDAGRWMLGAGCWALDAGCWALGAGRWALETGCWVLGAGCWVLGAGCWVLGAVCWMLCAGCWISGNEQRASSNATSSYLNRRMTAAISMAVCAASVPRLRSRLRQRTLACSSLENCRTSCITGLLENTWMSARA